MVVIKRLYTFMLQRFLPLLAMTFFIVLFIVMMQMLWRYIDDLVGKGVPMDVFAELFFYMALSSIPQALPLAVLLASLMTFGNLGEKFELTALKAAGISLYKIMKPLIIFMVAVVVAILFYQDRVVPMAQTKMWTRLLTIRQKSPEMEIPEKSFYNQIDNINLYVDHKNRDTGMLYDMVIYRKTMGSSDASVILADSGRLSFTEDKKNLYLHLYSGKSFEKFRMRDVGAGYSYPDQDSYRGESFESKTFYIPFDANLNMMNDSVVGSQYVGKNMAQLRHSIDSIHHRVDSIGANYGDNLRIKSYANAPSYRRVSLRMLADEQRAKAAQEGAPAPVAAERAPAASEAPVTAVDSSRTFVLIPPRMVEMDKPLDVDSIFNAPNPAMAKSYVSQALAKAIQHRDNYSIQVSWLNDEAKIMRRHEIELQKKFTLSLACLIFFFIGAPLGAIIKKGGLGTPLVISVFLFIFYYIIDNTGYKMARDGKIVVWAGVWLSSMVLMPLGAFLTYKAVGDSEVFNFDAYRNFIDRLRGKRPKRSLEVKTVIMDEMDPRVALSMLSSFVQEARSRLALHRSWVDRLLGRPPLTALDDSMNSLIDYLSNSDDKMVIALLNEYPFDLNYKNLQSVIQNSRSLMLRLGAEVDSVDDAFGDDALSMLQLDDVMRVSLSKIITDEIKDAVKACVLWKRKSVTKK